MDLRKLKKLIDLVQESGIAELEVKEGEEAVRITRVVGTQQTVYLPSGTVNGVQQGLTAPSTPRLSSVDLDDDEPEQETGHTLKSPMVGTFYPIGDTRRQVVRRYRPIGRRGRDAMHHRGDEAHERDRG
jgi:acetyl-CoA carboxylase biotin carboxyl carrier protein